MPSRRLERLSARRIDPSQSVTALNEVYRKISEDDAVKYAIGAMQPIDPDYTRNTIAEGDRVCAQLDPGLKRYGIGAEFKYQGSVTNDTHIRAHSDIDILMLHTRFWSLEPPQQPAYPYVGDVLDDLRQMRIAAIEVLRNAYPSAEIDASGGKAICLSGGSLRRCIDAIPSNWWDTNAYAQTGQGFHRGVMILDSKQNARICNKPFLHNKLIDDRDRQTNGNLRKVARLLKSVKYDAESPVQISSYDIASIAYRMPDTFLTAAKGQELRLVQSAADYLRYLSDNATYRDTLEVPNEMRRIFGVDGASATGLSQLLREISSLLREIEEGLTRSFRKLAEARIAY